jgi:hypothetical protein
MDEIARAIGQSYNPMPQDRANAYVPQNVQPRHTHHVTSDGFNPSASMR